jgi:hypothetical protein
MAGSSRRYLVIVRAGEKSLHRGWLDGSRNWDLVVSWYGNEPYTPIADERVIDAKGWKWDVLAQQFEAHPELVDDYDYVWMPDDDLATDAASINELFRLSAEHKLAVSQPGLTPDSYFCFIQTLRSPSFILRYSSFIEIMAPCLSQATLRRALPYFKNGASGYGLDWLWTRLEDDNWQRAAIIDASAVHHTRPIGGFLRGRMEASQRDPDEEGRTMLRRFGDPQVYRQFFTYGGIGRDGRHRGLAATAWWMLVDYFQMQRQWVQENGWGYVYILYRRLPLGTQLSRLREVAPPEPGPVETGAPSHSP